MSSRLIELAREHDDLEAKLYRVKAEINRITRVDDTPAPAPKRAPQTRPAPARQQAQPPRRPAPAPQVRTPPAAEPRQAPPSVTAEEQQDETVPDQPQDEAVDTGSNGESNGEGNGRQPSLKDVILNQVLANSRGGMELKEIVAEITRMIQNGEYKTKAQKVTPIVSQALHQLKAERLVSVEKSQTPPHRNLYSLGETA